MCLCPVYAVCLRVRAIGKLNIDTSKLEFKPSASLCLCSLNNYDSNLIDHMERLCAVDPFGGSPSDLIVN